MKTREFLENLSDLMRQQLPPELEASPIVSPPRERTANEVGFTLAAMREEVAAAVNDLRAHGDGNIHYVDGLRLFGHELAHLLPDDLHPNAEGYKALAQNFISEVADGIFAVAPATASSGSSGLRPPTTLPSQSA